MSVSGLTVPHPALQTRPLSIAMVDVAHLIQVHWPGGALRQSRDGSCRFDEPVWHPPLPNMPGTCYFGTSVMVSFAESVLHEVVPGLQHTLAGWKCYVMSFAEKIAPRLVSDYKATHPGHTQLRLADLCGTGLHQLGCSTTITSTLRDDVPELYRYSQAWGNAIRRHPDNVDGIRFIPSHLNQHGYAIAVFEHALPKLMPAATAPLALIQSAEPANDFAGLVESFQLGFAESPEEIKAIVEAL
jgi:hypothetical protein